jgi:Reverse transcriptase (RNA-dependent DNA polymerase)
VIGSSEAARLPVDLAIRLLLDSTSYTNAVPEWFEPLQIDYLARARRLSTSIDAYVSGSKPEAAFDIVLPKRSGGSNRWLVPSVNDQIICQAAVSAIAKPLQNVSINPAVVFSCNLNTDPNRMAFLNDQVADWQRFEGEIESRCNAVNCILQFDLEKAFTSFRVSEVLSFLRRKLGDSAAITLLDIFLVGWSGGRDGLPFVNDSLFFIGNCYLQTVDDVVARYTNNYVRFMDDYKIFGGTPQELETVATNISRDLKDIGLRLNDGKTVLGSAEEYLAAIAKLKFKEVERSTYTDPTAYPGLFNPSDMHRIVSSCIREPATYLQQGFGRLQLASIRRMRVRSLYSVAQGYPDSDTISALFSEKLSEDEELLELACTSLETYSKAANESWRLIWLLYLSKDFHLDDKTEGGKKWNSLVADIRGSNKVSPVCRIWAKSMPDFPSATRWEKDLEELHALGYLERGKRCYGA